MMFPTIKTNRLVLRAFQSADAADLAAYRNLPEVAALQTWESFSLEDAQKLITQMQTLKRPTAFEWFQIAVTLEGKLIGDLAFKLEDRQAEIGFSFDPVYQKKGYATEAVTALLEFAFDELRLHRVHATTDPRNTNSMGLLERLGFRKEGHLLENFWFKGAWVDDVLYGILAREWNEGKVS